MSVYEFDVNDDEPVEVGRKKTILTGGYYDLGKNKYWIDEPLYSEVVARDEASPLTPKGDREFGKWLHEFLKKHGIKPERKEVNTRSMAGYWAMPYAPVSTKTDSRNKKVIKMASVLRAMRSVVSVVDPEHKLTVEYNHTSSTSSWDAGNKVMLPVEPIDEIDDLEECINVMGGFTTHEAFHSQETRKLLTATVRDYLDKSGWNMWIANLLEDPRIEEVGLSETPGYIEYLNYVKEYLWSEKGLATKWPDQPQERFRAAIALIRYQDRVDEVLTDESFVTPREWLRDWDARYRAAQAAKLSGQTLIDFVEEGKKFFEIKSTTPEPKKTFMVCGMVHEGSSTSPDDILQVDIAIEEEKESASKGSKAWAKILGKAHRDIGGFGDGMPSVVVRRPMNHKKFKPIKGGLIEKAKAALVLRKTVAQHDTREQLSGMLDEDELYRFAAKDYRIFKDATVESLPSAAVYLLVDMSGSMGDPSYSNSSAHYAATLAQIFTQALTTHPNVRVRVLGHTGQNRDNGTGGSFYRIWEQGDSLDRLSILWDGSLYSENFDGWAIAWAGNLLKQEQVDHKLLVVLADGQPSARGYGGSRAQAHVRRVTDSLLHDGVSVVQVAVGPYLDEESQKRMFKHYIAVSTYRGTNFFPIILRKLTKLLRKVV